MFPGHKLCQKYFFKHFIYIILLTLTKLQIKKNILISPFIIFIQLRGDFYNIIQMRSLINDKEKHLKSHKMNFCYRPVNIGSTDKNWFSRLIIAFFLVMQVDSGVLILKCLLIDNRLFPFGRGY